MIGKYRPSFLPRQPKHTVPQGTKGADLDLSQLWHLLAEQLRATGSATHQTGLPRKQRGKAWTAHHDMDFPWKRQDGATSPWRLRWDRRYRWAMLTWQPWSLGGGLYCVTVLESDSQTWERLTSVICSLDGGTKGWLEGRHRGFRYAHQ